MILLKSSGIRYTWQSISYIFIYTGERRALLTVVDVEDESDQEGKHEPLGRWEEEEILRCPGCMVASRPPSASNGRVIADRRVSSLLMTASAILVAFPPKNHWRRYKINSYETECYPVIAGCLQGYYIEAYLVF